MPTLRAADALRTLARWLASDREARQRTRRILARWERAPGRPPAQRATPMGRVNRPGSTEGCTVVGAPHSVTDGAGDQVRSPVPRGPGAPVAGRS